MKKKPTDLAEINLDNKTYQFTIRIHHEMEVWLKEHAYQNRTSMAHLTYDLLKKYRAKVEGKK